MKLRKSSSANFAAGRYQAQTHRYTDVLVRRQGDRYSVEPLPRESDAADAPWGLVPDELTGFTRRLDLPPADAATTRRLVDVQMEQLLPGQVDHLTWSSRELPGGSTRLVAAVASRRLQQLIDAASTPRPPGAVLTPPLALLECFDLWQRPDETGPLDVIAVQHERMHLLLDVTGPKASVVTVDLEHGNDDAAAAIAREVGRQRAALDAEVMPAPRRFCLLFDRPSDAASLREPIEQAWGQPSLSLEQCLTLGDASGLSLGELVAAGSAAAVLRPTDSINLLAHAEGADAGKTSRRVTVIRWSAAALALAAAVAGYVTADTIRSQAQAQVINQAGLERQQQSRLDTELAVARYLETSGPGVLPILDELGRLTRDFMVDDLRYERSGQFVLRATARSADDINRLARELSNMTTLDSVRVRSQNAKGRDEIEYTLVAVPASDFQGLVNPPATPPSPAAEPATPTPAAPDQPTTEVSADGGPLPEDAS